MAHSVQCELVKKLTHGRVMHGARAPMSEGHLRDKQLGKVQLTKAKNTVFSK